MEIIFLGTTCMMPTKERNHAGVFISYKDEGILVDCGEGIQRQFKIADIRLTRITKILITHWHGDHVLGLPGLFQSLSASDYDKTLEIYGPSGTKEKIKNMLDVFIFDNNVKYKVIELKQGKFFENNDYILECAELEHGVKTFGYVLQEKDRRRIKVPFIRKIGMPDGPLLGKLQQGKDVTFKGKKITAEEATYIVKGKKLAIISDTVLCEGCYTLAKDADILISESAYAEDLEDKAEQYKHLTAKQAALIASQSNVGRLILTHFSQRYKDTSQIESDAKTYFDDITCAYDFLKVKM